MQRESSVSPGEIKNSSYGNTDRVMEYAAARIWSSVCHLGVNVYVIRYRVWYVTSLSHVGAEIAQWDSSGLDSQYGMQLLKKVFYVQEN